MFRAFGSILMLSYLLLKANAFVCFVPKTRLCNFNHVNAHQYPTSFTDISHRKLCHYNDRYTKRKSSAQMSIINGLNVDDLVYNAQSSASELASFTIKGASESGTSSLASLAILYVAGLLTSFSPCSLGLLPLTVSYISTAAGEREDKAALFPTIAFAAGLAFVFCGLGLSVSFLGGVFGQTFSSSDDGFFPSLALVLLASGVSISMGLQLLDIINVPLPSMEINLPFLQKESDHGESSSIIEFDEEGNIIQKPLTTKSAEGETGGNSLALLRVFLLGGSCALLESPCATPVLTSILAFVGVSQNPILGATLLLTYTIGYSTPLLLVGATGGEALAKLQASSDDNAFNDDGNAFKIIPKIGQFVSPLTGGILIWYGTNALLTGLFGDASLSGLSPVL